MGTPTLVCVWSCSAPAGRPFRMSTIVFVDLEISTQADGAQSSRVPVPFPEDPYEAIRQAYLVGTDTESEPFEDLVETETPESPHTVASPTSLPDSTPPTCHVEESEGSDTSGARSTSSDSTAPLSPDHPLTHTTPTLVPILRRFARMVVRVPPTMSPGLSASIAEVAAISDSAFLEDDEEEDEEIEESSNYDSKSNDVEDEGLTIEDEDPAAGDEGLAAGDEGPGIGVVSLSLGGDAAVPEGQQRATPVVETAVEDGIAYIDVPAYPPPAPPAQTPLSLEWSSGSLPFSPTPSIVPSPISSPVISLTVTSPVASPATAEAEGFLTELGAQVEMQGGLIHDHTVRLGELSPALFEWYDRDIGELFTRSGAVRDEIFSQRYRFRSLEHERERVAMNFRVIWRPVLALESWVDQTDAQKAALWHVISDTQMENQELRLQIAEERRARLDLAEIVDSMRRG
ncbi:hypothetical protein Tco_0528405 [Tanacetum coccineum]